MYNKKEKKKKNGVVTIYEMSYLYSAFNSSASLHSNLVFPVHTEESGVCCI